MIKSMMFVLLFIADRRLQQQLPLFFRDEPPSSVVFLNSTGAVIPCEGGGASKPRAIWTRPDGTPLTPIPGLRQFRNDGSMVLQPFAGDLFRTEVHSGLFRCQLTSDAGSIGSRDVRVTAGEFSPCTEMDIDSKNELCSSLGSSFLGVGFDCVRIAWRMLAPRDAGNHSLPAGRKVHMIGDGRPIADGCYCG